MDLVTPEKNCPFCGSDDRSIITIMDEGSATDEFLAVQCNVCLSRSKPVPIEMLGNSITDEINTQAEIDACNEWDKRA